MSWERWLFILTLSLFAAMYYLMAGLALRDLWRRPAVRGDNKVTWVLVILCLPIAGALLYGYMGAASFLPRKPAAMSQLTGSARSLAKRPPDVRQTIDRLRRRIGLR